MLRVFKHYHLNVADSATAASSIAASSYPGTSLISVVCIGRGVNLVGNLEGTTTDCFWVQTSYSQNWLC